jgi:hypothetical protein
MVVTAFCHHEGVDFWQLFSIKNCKSSVNKIGGVKIVNMGPDFEGWKKTGLGPTLLFLS